MKPNDHQIVLTGYLLSDIRTYLVSNSSCFCASGQRPIFFFSILRIRVAKKTENTISVIISAEPKNERENLKTTAQSHIN